MKPNTIDANANEPVIHHRTHTDISGPDIWSPQACLLIEDHEPAIRKLTAMCGKRPGNPLPGSRPYTQLIKDPGYIPYSSAKVPVTSTGDEMSQVALETMYSPELQRKLYTGPQTAAAALTAATVAVGKTVRGQWIPEIDRILPKKGNEVQRLWQEYRKHSPRLEDATPMMMRDFFSSSFAWQFIRMRDSRIQDLGGAIMCITTGSDFVGSDDDPGMGKMDIYLRAMNEGLACLGGSAVTPAIRDAVLCASFMQVRNTVTKATFQKDIQTLKQLLHSCGGPVTPEEFMTMRWWEAAMVGYHRIGLGAEGYLHLSDETGVFLSTRKCKKIRRAVDSLIRYDEAVDILQDGARGDGVNELLVAMLTAGRRGVAGYAHALAAVTDEVFECDCGEDGHIEVGEMAMASSLWYMLIPRYLIRSQLDAVTQANPRLKQAFAPPAPGARNILCKTLPGRQLHTNDWQPLWTITQADVSALVAKAVRRILLEGSYDALKLQRCQKAAYDVLSDCMTLENDSPQLLSLAGKWRVLFNEALAGVGQEYADLTTSLGELVERIWIHLIIGDHGKNGDTDARLFVDVDRNFRRTYLAGPAAGLAIRRAFLGVVSGSVELSGFNPYSCLVEGAANICEP